LYELLKNEKFMGVSLKLVRKFAVQILRTLQVLADAQLIHCDLKPENIMVVNYNQTKVNVIDFGSSCFGEEKGPMYIQSRFYRSPEVLLGVPYNCQADMWSFGCIMCEMFTGRPIFTGKDAEDQLMKITSLFGRPIETMMAKRRQFMQGTKEYNQLMKQPEPYAFAERFRKVGYTIISGRSAKRGTDEIKTDETGRVVDEDLLQFIDLVTKCLVLDPDTRLTPKEALLHPFCQKLIKSTQRVATIHESPSTCAQEDTMSTSSAVEASTTVKQAVES
jgi:serine/threonine protein kinase